MKLFAPVAALPALGLCGRNVTGGGVFSVPNHAVLSKRGWFWVFFEPISSFSSHAIGSFSLGQELCQTSGLLSPRDVILSGASGSGLIFIHVMFFL